MKMHVIIICFGYLFLLFAVEARSDVYHDLGPSHIDTNLIAISQANHKNDMLPNNGIISPLVLPKVLVQLIPSVATETNHSSFTLIGKFPSRASPA